MIYYLVAQRHAYTMGDFLAGLGRPLAGRIRILLYEDLFSSATVRLPAATYIFTSMGREMGARNPPSPLRKRCSDLHRNLVQLCGPGRVLNDPARFLSRYDLLQVLERRGINRFAVWRAGVEAPRRYPVFLRSEHGTLWQAPPLLPDKDQYEAALRGAGGVEGLIAVEHRDTADAAGVYRKHGCFIVGDRIVPRHLFFSRSWLVKEADIVEPAMLEEEMSFLERNPHEQFLREVSRIGNIHYGRIDYAVADDRPQVWEINITPSIAGAISSKIGARQPAHEKFLALFSAALDGLDPPSA